MTSGLKNEDFGINVPNTNALAPGLASIVITGFFNLGDAQQPFVKRVNEVFQFTDDFTWTPRQPRAQVRRATCARSTWSSRSSTVRTAT